jgi:molybdopterin molybdotransferase
MLSVNEAQQRIVERVAPLGHEVVPIGEAHQRAVCNTIVATRTLPPFDNSAMDGYAVQAVDTQGATESSPRVLSIVETIAAGNIAKATLGQGEAMRIFTGAPMPNGADSVVMQENTHRAEDSVQIIQQAKLGEHVRRAGEDVTEGDTLFSDGDVINPGDIGMLASQGITDVSTYQLPRGAILPTGNEIIPIEQPLRPGQIPNSNSHMLAAQVRDAGAIATLLPAAADDPQALAKSLENAAQSHDLILTCGGVSVGDYDHVRTVMQDFGEVDFWKVALKPGKPLAFGYVCETPLIGLPGNPVSAFVCFELFARTAIARLAGRWHRDLEITATLRGKIRENKTREQFLRARVLAKNTHLEVQPLTHQGSGQLSSLVGVNGLVRIPPNVRAEDGDQVKVLLLDAPY